MEPKRLHPGAVLENGATLEGGAIFSLNNHVQKKKAILAPLFFSVRHLKISVHSRRTVVTWLSLAFHFSSLGTIIGLVCPFPIQEITLGPMGRELQNPQLSKTKPNQPQGGPGDFFNLIFLYPCQLEVLCLFKQIGQKTAM